MEAEFRAKSPSPTPGFAQAVISGLRSARKDHPVADAAAGLIPLVGGMQAGMDATDPDSSDFQRMLAVGSILPGMRLAKLLVGKLRRPAAKAVEEATHYAPEEIFQKPDLVMSAEAREAARKKMNDAYIKQLLLEEEQHAAGNVDVYHGTTGKFEGDKVDPKFFGSGGTESDLGSGFHTTHTPEDAGAYANWPAPELPQGTVHKFQIPKVEYDQYAKTGKSLKEQHPETQKVLQSLVPDWDKLDPEERMSQISDEDSLLGLIHNNSGVDEILSKKFDSLKKVSE